MSEKIITFAPKLTVGIQGYKPLSKENPELAFMTPNTNDASYRKRLITMEQWLGGRYRSDKRLILNTTMYHFDNEPLTGFRIMNVQSRYSTDNKFFRLIDPRGYILEISTGNLEMILQTSDIKAGGWIADPCVWGRDGGANVLVPTSAEIYDKSVSFADTKVRVAGLKPGDIVKDSHGTQEVYLGKFTICGKRTTREYTGRSYGNYGGSQYKETTTPIRNEKFHAFISKPDRNDRSYKSIRMIKSSSAEYVIMGHDESYVRDYYINDGDYKDNSLNIRTYDYSTDIAVIVSAKYKVSDVKWNESTRKVVVESTLKQFILDAK